MNVGVPASCSDCGAEVGVGLLACPGCARLIYAAELRELASRAKSAEAEGDLTAALSAWRRATELLPPGATQRATIESKMSALSARVDGRAPHGASGSKKAGVAAGVGAAGALLLKSKALLLALLSNGKLLLAGLLKLPTLLSMLVYAHWSTGRGTGIGLGILACIYVHEVGHVAALRRYGIEASAPMFVPGFGAFVRMKQYPTDAHEEARTGLAGPLWGLVAAALAAAIGYASDSETVRTVASLAATINLFNLIPVWQLDGARGLRALSRSQRIVVAIVAASVGALLHQWMPLVVAAVTLARSFAKDAHPSGDRGMFALFVSLVVLLAAVAAIPMSLPT